MEDKFRVRAWDKKSKKMLKSFKFTDWEKNSFFDFPCSQNENNKDCSSQVVEGECIIMECTGLKDKNDKLIYEGDVIKFKLSEYAIKYLNISPTNSISKVYRWKGYFAIEVYENNDIHINLNFGAYPTCELEVIGNIYENPELLKESDSEVKKNE